MSVLMWPVFGFTADVRSNIDPDHSPNAVTNAKGWTSVIFHITGSALTAFLSPVWGLCWGLFAVGTLARRLGHRRGIAVPASAWLLSGTPGHLAVMGASFVLPVIWALTNAGIWRTLGTIAVVAMLISSGIRASQWVSEAVAGRSAYGQWAMDLAPVFGGGTNPAVFEDSGFAANGCGVIIDPVSAGIAARFEYASADALLAMVRPDLEIDPFSTPQRIVINGASSQTQARRASLASSGGLIAGVGVAPIVPSFAPKHAAPTEQVESAQIHLSSEDLV